MPSEKNYAKGHNVKLTTEIQYAVRSLCDIAYYSEGCLTRVKSISERQDISHRYIELIFDKLKKKGIIKSLRGCGGGYLLARRPEQISIGDVIRAIDGKNIQLVKCHGGKRELGKPCEPPEKRAVSGMWDGASKRLMDYFDSVTINQICEEARNRGAGI